MHALSRRSVLMQAASAGLLGFLPGCGGPSDEAAAAGTLIIGQDPEPITLAAAGGIDVGAAAVSVAIFDRLFNAGLDGKPMPMLAQSGTWSADGRDLDLQLRPGLTWHDGTPLTSADVCLLDREGVDSQ